MKKLAVALAVLAAAAAEWALLRNRGGPTIPFAQVKRITLVSTLPTSGKAEPVEWQAIRAERAGTVAAVNVREGQQVRQGETVASISDPTLQAQIEGSEARVAEASANVAALQTGGKPAELADIESSLKQARLELEQQRRDAAGLERLAAKQAATRTEAESARQKVQQSEATIEGLEHRRRSLVASTDVAVARARLEDAQAALSLVRERATQNVVRSPLAGTIYGLAARAGAYVNPGDLLANVGQLDRMRVRLYVDEPELGRIAAAQPVAITWEALGGKQWKGSVERLPSAVQPLGTRRVGAVVCVFANPGRERLPGTNVGGGVRRAVAENAIAIPKEALRRDAAGTYVYRLDGETVERRAVQTGISNISQVQVTEGLAESDAVAMPTERPLKPGLRITPKIQGQ